MAHTSVLIKPASSLCSLRCKYCFYADVSSLREVRSFGVMEENTAQSLIENVFKGLKPGDQVSFLFQGGEPTMAGLLFFHRFTEMAKGLANGLKINYALQTNGILLDEEWCRFLKDNNFLVGLSLDGDAATHDKNRVDSQGNGTWSRVIKAKGLLDRWKVDYNILWVLTNEAARHPEKVWRFLKNRQIPFVQFIPCLAELESTEKPAYALSPRRFASFYTGLFRLWSQAFLKGEYISIKLFDDLFNLLVHGQVTACGFTGRCQNHFVAEADGGVYPCDFYVLDRWKMGNLQESTLMELARSPKAKEFLDRLKPQKAVCRGCPYFSMCAGGCPRMQDCICCDDSGFCGYREFLNSCASEIKKVLHFLSDM